MLVSVSRLLCDREADALVADVELGVVAADEHVAEDPERAVGRRDVQRHEPGQAHCLAELTHLDVERTKKPAMSSSLVRSTFQYPTLNKLMASSVYPKTGLVSGVINSE